MIEITLKEEKAINMLKELANNWPDTLWLYSASGDLCVMKKNNSQPVMTKLGSVDPKYVIETINIENDGGDW